jgi:uncharacterized NAD-dependent epimerase/dehydratase family protein
VSPVEVIENETSAAEEKGVNARYLAHDTTSAVCEAPEGVVTDTIPLFPTAFGGIDTVSVP